MAENTRNRRFIESSRVAFDASPVLLEGLGSMMSDEARSTIFDRENPIKFLSKKSVRLSVALDAKYRYEDDDVIALTRYQRTIDAAYGQQYRLHQNAIDTQATQPRPYLEIGLSLFLPTHRERSTLANPPFFEPQFKGSIDAYVQIPKSDLLPLQERRKAIRVFKQLLGSGPIVDEVPIAPPKLFLTNPVIQPDPIPIRTYQFGAESVDAVSDIE